MNDFMISVLQVGDFSYEYRSEFPRERVRKFIDSFRREPGTGCWVWKQAVDSRGYSKVSWKGKTIPAHRLSWMMFRGSVEGLDVHHLCRNHSCVNPTHLEAVTKEQHQALEAQARHRQFCPKGHPLEGQNLYIYPDRDKRRCNECNRIAQNEYRDKHRQELVASGVAEQRHIRNDGRRKSRLMLTHCRRGHEFTPENTRMFQGRRYCKKCHAENTLKYYHDRKSVALSAQGS